MNSQTQIQIPHELFAPAESLHFEGELSCPILEVGPDSFTFEQPIAWLCDISNVGDALLVRGSAHACAQTCCARCLEPCAFDLEGEIEGYYIISDEHQAPDDLEGDEFEFLSDNQIIDLEPLILAGLRMDVPLQPLCSDDCLGLCPQCGKNLNSGSCACNPDEAKADDFSKNPFSVLKDYHFEED